MLAADQKPVQIFNELILINNNRIDGYIFTSGKTEVVVLKDLFSRLIETSILCKKELTDEVYKLGGKLLAGCDEANDFSTRLETTNEVLIQKDHLSLLKSCDLKEKVMIMAYENALNEEDENITAQHHRLFERHYQLLKTDRNKVRNLLSVLLKAKNNIISGK